MDLDEETWHLVRETPKVTGFVGDSTDPAPLGDGIGPGFIPPLWEDSTADEVVSVATAEAKAMSRRLAREEALFVGTSSGANVVAALRTAQALGPGRTVVTILCDSGMKYLSTDLYSVG